MTNPVALLPAREHDHVSDLAHQNTKPARRGWSAGHHRLAIPYFIDVVAGGVLGSGQEYGIRHRRHFQRRPGSGMSPPPGLELSASLQTPPPLIRLVLNHLQTAKLLQ